MKSPARLGFLLVACLLAPLVLRADAAPLMPTLSLKDGRVLHNVRIMENEDDSIVVHADEGLLKIMRSDLPNGVAAPSPPAPGKPADSGLVMVPFNPNQAEPQLQGAKPAPKVSPVPKVPVAPKVAVVNPVFHGCTIVSFQMKAFQSAQGCAEVVIRNDSDQIALILPRDIVCLNAKGQKRGGRFMVSDGFPPQVKRREFVPAGGQIDDIVTFTDDALDISNVQWAK